MEKLKIKFQDKQYPFQQTGILIFCYLQEQCEMPVFTLLVPFQTHRESHLPIN